MNCRHNNETYNQRGLLKRVEKWIDSFHSPKVKQKPEPKQNQKSSSNQELKSSPSTLPRMKSRAQDWGAGLTNGSLERQAGKEHSRLETPQHLGQEDRSRWASGPTQSWHPTVRDKK